MLPINLHDYEMLAEQRLEKANWDYYQGGSDDELTLRTTRSEYERIRLRPRMLVDVSTCDLSTTVLNIPVSMPVLAAPTAFHGLAHLESECATARAVGAAGTLMIASTASSSSLEEIAKAATGPLWLQLYVRTPEDARIIVQRAEAVGYQAIVLTVDTPRVGNRERDIRNNFNLTGRRTGNYKEGDGLFFSQSLTWDFLPWLRSHTALPLLVKGVLTAEDAHLAVEHGAAGIIVSNHGGRQLDGCVHAIEALPEIVDAVAGRCEILCDGGIRRGTDIIKALALGAKAVCVGRPLIWGLSVNGQAGAQHILEILRGELDLSCALLGCPDLKKINRSYVKYS